MEQKGAGKQDIVQQIAKYRNKIDHIFLLNYHTNLKYDYSVL